jgi:hydroxymethylbilane synthase
VTRTAIRIGTRGSALALAQAQLVAAALRQRGIDASLTVIETAGDRRRPDTAWGEGAFVRALETAILERRADVAVHSAKDIPTDQDERLGIAAYLPRADARDALVVAGGGPAAIDALPSQARVGTDSPRRTGFLLARRPDLRLHPLHGNVDTRLRRLEDGETDALVLACAGLDRLGLNGRVGARLDPETVPPAPGQGAIAVQVEAGRSRLRDALAAVDDADTRIAVEAERALLAAAGGGCRAPVGVLASVRDGRLRMIAGRVEPNGDGAVIRRREGAVDAIPEVVRALHADLFGVLAPDVVRSVGPWA